VRAVTIALGFQEYTKPVEMIADAFELDRAAVERLCEERLSPRKVTARKRCDIRAYARFDFVHRMFVECHVTKRPVLARADRGIHNAKALHAKTRASLKFM